MVKLPDTLLREIGKGVGTDKTASYQTIYNKFVLSGYGPNKAKKWIAIYEEIGVLRAELDENKKLRYWCLWW